MNLSSDCFNIISLSTCLLNTNQNPNWFFENIGHIEFSSNLNAIVKYEYICSDEMSLFEYEDHFFSIEFFKDGRFIDYYAYEKKCGKGHIGNIANPELSKDVKMELLSKIRPGLIERFKTMSLHSTLTTQELKLIDLKSKELSSLVLEQNQKKF